MKVVFRVDASQKIGSGHVMRCLALAEMLRSLGGSIDFIMRDYIGNLNEHVKRQGFNTYLLLDQNITIEQKNLNKYEQCTGFVQEIDAEKTIHILAFKKIDWLIIDHYEIDKVWENKLRLHSKKIMVIDDMANRHHNCDILLDQTFGRKELDYKGLVPDYCNLLLGSENSLLHSSFKKLRQKALQRRKNYNNTNSILISIGSMDEKNITSRVLKALSSIIWKNNTVVNVVLTSSAPYLQAVIDSLFKYKYPVNVLIDVTNMAELMLESDLAIGAGGTTSWERCCLALPTVLIILAENQRNVGERLAQVGATITIQENDKLENNIKQAVTDIMQDKILYMDMSNKAAEVSNGDGVKRVAEKIISLSIGSKNGI